MTEYEKIAIKERLSTAESLEKDIKFLNNLINELSIGDQQLIGVDVSSLLTHGKNATYNLVNSCNLSDMEIKSLSSVFKEELRKLLDNRTCEFDRL